MSGIDGVGVVRFPAQSQIGDRSAREVAHELAQNIQVGCIICLPNTKDSYGEYEWNFRIEPATEGQVKVIHIECNEPYVKGVVK